ncbi:sulfurtransferase complex subunit TusB [Serratia microhaemolytica]|uniref:sulfurtransferase complex subunit TusB n=1 Tax=Serratia microhaemolytica TaxID=2675110 RepID=UPI000FDD5994|nr:sulfurtransferase complex subunit TusB [Serratia microhaemolytica]
MLYTVSRSPTCCDLPALLRLTAPGDDLLLWQDGVVAGLDGSASLALLLNAPVTLYALSDDLDARGLSAHLDCHIIRISYQQLVELTQKHPAQVAW